MPYRSPTTAMKHQTAAITACRRKPPAPCPTDAFGYLMDMGTGKSKVVLDEWGENAMNGGAPDMLIVAPAGSYRNWFADKGEDPENWSEIRKHLDPALRARTVVHGWRGGGTKGERDTLAKFLALRDARMPRVLVINVEALSSVERARELCTEFVRQRRAHMVVDESTTIKSHKSERTEMCWELGALARSRRILSGLWTPKGPLDTFAQCMFLDHRILGQTNYFAFQRRYAQMVKRSVAIRTAEPDRHGNLKHREFWQVVGYRNIEELQRRVAPYTYRVLLEDCVELAGLTYDAREVELTAEQRRMINEIRLFGNASIGDTGRFVTTDMIIKQITRISQIACGYVLDDEERVLHEVPEQRTEALLGTLAEHRGKAVIWCPWKPPLFRIVERLRKEYGPRAVAQFHGDNMKTRAAEERRFLEDPECLYMCATQGAGMRGNTWVVADLMVYYANNYDLEQRDQSERRTYRRGQTRPVRCVDLMAPGTNDEKIVKNLRKKIDLSAMINREGYREWLI